MRCTPRSADGSPQAAPVVPTSFWLAPAGLVATARSLRLLLRLSEKGMVDMSRPTTRTPVAIFNSHAEFVDALREALDREGLPTATALLAEIQDGTLDLVAFLEEHDPRVIVYDLPRPFERHWNFLRLLRQTDALRNRTWILTTTDKKALDPAVGALDVIEIAFGAPYDLGAVVKAVHHALADVRRLRPESGVRRAPRGIAPAPVSIAQEAAAQLAIAIAQARLSERVKRLM